MKRKGQIKMAETMGILLIFFVLLILAAAFFIRIKAFSAAREIQEVYEFQAIETAQKISYLPEILCSENNLVRDNCYDKYKLKAMNDTIQSNFNFYAIEFGYVTIEINTTYPPVADGAWTVYDNKPAQFSTAPVSNFPVAIYDALTDKYYFGTMKVVVYN